MRPQWGNPLASYEIKSSNDVEKAVLALRDKWKLGINVIPNLIETIEDNGVKVVYVDADKDFDGLANYACNIPIIILNKNIKDVARLRFTLTHELGYLLLNLDTIADKKGRETFCHNFAGAFLIPKQIIREFGEEHRGKCFSRINKCKRGIWDIYPGDCKKIELLRNNK